MTETQYPNHDETELACRSGVCHVCTADGIFRDFKVFLDLSNATTAPTEDKRPSEFFAFPTEKNSNLTFKYLPLHRIRASHPNAW